MEFNTFNYTFKIRFHILQILVFSFILFSCSESKKGDAVTVFWNGSRAESLIIPNSLLPGVAKDSIRLVLQVRLANSKVPILGEYVLTTEAVIFRPLIAFTRGMKYEVYLREKMLGKIEIPPHDPKDAPNVVAVYPSGNVLPQNLLKFYIGFSKPMQEGMALNNIIFIKNLKDTLSAVFLDLQQELWNKDRTMITLWLDPGRIKRDLQPNINLGPPLEEGASYQLIIKKGWKDTDGISLPADYTKIFIAGEWDSLSPDPSQWKIHAPGSGSKDPVRLELHEALDHSLLINAVRILDESGNIINTINRTDAVETILNLFPADAWDPGAYTIEIESRLEDLAGNNLNRLFDKDLTVKDARGYKEIHKRSFRIF